MQTIYQSKYAKHEYDQERKILFTEWFKETANMTTEEYKNEIHEWLNALRKCRAEYLYENCLDWLYPIAPDEQTWLANLVNPEFIKLGLKKYAYIAPEELFSKVSVEQLFDDFFQMNLENQYPIVSFADGAKAIEWLMAKDEKKALNQQPN